ncbi:MAG: ABC transporter ATP-binding protein [Synergistaceae bacterium]|nr:ABC transporter ATP-binding protein [Synergistaceae bacterium]
MTDGGADIALSYDKLSKSFGRIRALDGVELSIRRGEIFGFIGPDGAGKTTMMRIAMGIINPTAGKCYLLGDSDRKKTRVLAGYVPQMFSLYVNMSVMENINLFGSLYGKPEREVHSRAEYILSRVGLWGFRERYAGNLSGGMKQKLALAIGLLNTPEILLLDEPTTGVDPVARREFWALLYQFNNEGLTIVVSTPYMDEAELCTRKMFLNKGRILDVGTTSELLSRYPYKLLCVEYNSRTAFNWLTGLPHVIDANMFGSKYHIVTDDIDGARRSVEEAFISRKLAVPVMYRVEPGLEDLFVAFAGKDG